MLTLLLSGCATDKIPISSAPVCDALSVYVDNHADALIEDGGPKSRVTGVELIARYDGGCP
jgi:hypothetical protein